MGGDLTLGSTHRQGVGKCYTGRMPIHAIITGATGMVGRGVLLECLESDAVASVTVIGRRPVGIEHPKLKEFVLADVADLQSIAADLGQTNACFFCLGVSSFRMAEAQYRKLTYTLTLDFANALATISPDVTFCYVSGAGTDAASKTMWARVKGETENALLGLPFRAAYMFRPGMIQPLKGVKPSNTFYAAFMPVVSFLFPVFRAIVPKMATTSVNVGLAMINAAAHGYDRTLIESDDINTLAQRLSD